MPNDFKRIMYEKPVPQEVACGLLKKNEENDLKPLETAAPNVKALPEQFPFHAGGVPLTITT